MRNIYECGKTKGLPKGVRGVREKRKRKEQGQYIRL